MADRVSLSIGVLAVLGIAGVYFVMNSRLSERDAKDAARDASDAARDAKDAAREAKDAAEDAARKQFLAEPAKFLQCQSVRFATDWATASLKDSMAAATLATSRGGHGVTWQVVEATLKNTSPYAVADVRGNVEYRSNGKLLATVPASAAGLLLADHTVPLVVTAGEVTARADQKETVFVVTSVAIVSGR